MKSTKGAPVAQTESLAANSFALYRVAPLIGLERDAFRIVLLRSVIPEERHQAVPGSLQHMPDKADHGLRTAFMKDGCGARNRLDLLLVG
jgi:hypothetical protein